MKRKVSIMLIGILILTINLSIVSSSDTGIVIERQNIDIEISESGLLIEENIILNNTGNENATSVKFWIQQSASDVKILAVDSGKYLTPILFVNNRECNLSENNLSIEPGNSFDIKITYGLPTNTENFEKTISYDTTSLSVTFRNEQLYQVQNVQSGSSFSVNLFKPTEAPLNIIYIVIIFLLVVILIASTLFLLRKQRSKAKNSIVDSEEALNTKKALLLSLLKDIEKQHRSKEISDETYTKLKDEYKQQAVEVMKKLEDIKK